MSKQIDINAAEAVSDCKARKLSSNTYTTVEGTSKDKDQRVDLYLFDNLIARYFPHLQRLEITLAGYGTVTTRARLNALLQMFDAGSVWQENKQQWYSPAVSSREEQDRVSLGEDGECDQWISIDLSQRTHVGGSYRYRVQGTPTEVHVRTKTKRVTKEVPHRELWVAMLYFAPEGEGKHKLAHAIHYTSEREAQHHVDLWVRDGWSCGENVAGHVQHTTSAV